MGKTKYLNVLYGFKSEKIESSITKEITLRGYEVRSTMRTTKDLIKEYVNSHKELDVVILKEYLDGGGMYSPIELTELVDDAPPTLNVVIVIATSHRGKAEMRELYAAGILNVYFSDGKFGANPDKLADLAVKTRTKRQAREYYHINEIVPDHINLSYEQFRDNYKYLVDNSMGVNIADRFVTIDKMLYPGQMGAFIDDLPDRVKDILLQYREFYDIANKCYRLGMAKQKYRVPKGIKKGVTKEGVLERFEKDENEVFADEVRLTSVQSSSASEEVKEAYTEEPEVAEEEKEVVRKRDEKPKKEKKQRKPLFGRKKKAEQQSLFDEVGIDEQGAGDTEYDGLAEMRKAEALESQKAGASMEIPAEMEVAPPMPEGVTEAATTQTEIVVENPVGGQTEQEPVPDNQSQTGDTNGGDEGIIISQEEGEIDYSKYSVEELMAMMGK